MLVLPLRAAASPRSLPGVRELAAIPKPLSRVRSPVGAVALVSVRVTDPASRVVVLRPLVVLVLHPEL